MRRLAALLLLGGCAQPTPLDESREASPAEAAVVYRVHDEALRMFDTYDIERRCLLEPRVLFSEDMSYHCGAEVAACSFRYGREFVAVLRAEYSGNQRVTTSLLIHETIHATWAVCLGAGPPYRDPGHTDPRLWKQFPDSLEYRVQRELL